jgi:hypothetical protein
LIILGHSPTNIVFGAIAAAEKKRRSLTNLKSRNGTEISVTAP